MKSTNIMNIITVVRFVLFTFEVRRVAGLLSSLSVYGTTARNINVCAVLFGRGAVR